MKPRILTVGHACLDIVHRVGKIPKPNTKVDSREVLIQIGGNAANCAKTLSEIGATVDLCTVLGSEDHPFTRILVSLLRSHGIGTSFCAFDNTQPGPSSTIMVLDDGERAIVNWQGDSIKGAVSTPSRIGDYGMVMGDAYRLPMIRQVFSMASSAGVPTMIDVDGPVDDVGVIPRADYIWFSYEAWKRQRIPLADLRSRFDAVVGITDGDRPVSWIDREGVIRYYQPPSVVAVNTLGAGDAFRARFGVGICIGETIEQAVAGACETACEHITMKPLTRICQ